MIGMKAFSIWALLAVTLSSVSAQKAPAPYGPVPTKAQLNWHEMEMYCIIHFGVDTYTDKEWGFGDEDPKLVYPKKFDAMQIVGAAKAGGFKGVVIVVKHHDGLCLWPTATTDHNISKSNWKNGHGDIMKEYQLACNKLNMQLGAYCSPWDRNSALYGTPAYVKIYRDQLKELYSNYGKLFVSWHDGANGGDGYYGRSRGVRKIDRTTYYGWDTTWALTRKMQPSAVIFGDVGPDVRWVGNEEGHAGETCWATYTPLAPKVGERPANGYSKYELATEGTRNGKYWMPAECDVSLRPGWFYHDSQNDQVKTPYQLLDLYYKSVGRGAALDLGLAPNRDGLLDQHDVASLTEFGNILKRTFAVDMTKGATVKASNVRGGNQVVYGAQKLLDHDRYSYWATDDGMTTPELTLTLNGTKNFNVIRLRENIKLGQRIEAFEIQAWLNGKWEQIAAATSIGSNRSIRLPKAVITSKVRLKINRSPVCIALSELGLYKEPDHVEKPVIVRDRSGQVKIETPTEGSLVLYTTDGSTPTVTSPVYHGAFDLPNGGTVKALVIMDKLKSEVAVATFGLAKAGWKAVSTPMVSGQGNASKAIDDDVRTLWSTITTTDANPFREAQLTVDIGHLSILKAFTYLPRQDNKIDGIVDRYKIWVSTDGANWQEVAQGEFSNIRANPVQQTVTFDKPVNTRFVRFGASHVIAGSGATAAEVGLITQ